MSEFVNNAPSGVVVAVPDPNSPAPSPAPPAAPPVSAAAPPAATGHTTQTMASGGGISSGSWNDFLKSVNPIEVGFMVLGAAALMFIIHYYRQKAILEKNQVPEFQRQLDELTMNLRTAMKDNYKTL